MRTIPPACQQWLHSSSIIFYVFVTPHHHQAHRSTTMLPNISETGDVRRDSRSAMVAMATEGGATGEQDPVDDVVEYEEGFKMVEKYNIISVSGNGYYTGVFRMQMQHSRNSAALHGVYVFGKRHVSLLTRCYRKCFSISGHYGLIPRPPSLSSQFYESHTQKNYLPREREPRN